MTAEQVDVLVIGLGPGGGAAAESAVRSGLKVLAIERKRRIGDPVQCAEFIPLPLQRHALAERVSVQRITGMSTVLPSGQRFASAFPGLMIDRARFDRAFADSACSAGAQIRAAARLVDLDCVRSLASIAIDGRRVRVHYSVLIAADGPHSTVAKLLGWPPLKVIHTRQYSVPLRAADTVTEAHLSPSYPGGYAWLFPKGATANLGVGFDERLGGRMKARLDALHAALVDCGRLGAEVLNRTGGAIPVGGLRPHLTEGNIAFVGDAAGCTHPVTGAGIAAAVISGDGAARAAAALLHAGRADALESYEEDMRDLFQASLDRACARRRELLRGWSTAAAKDDGLHRRGWIAFEDFYAR